MFRYYDQTYSCNWLKNSDSVSANTLFCSVKNFLQCLYTELTRIVGHNYLKKLVFNNSTSEYLFAYHFRVCTSWERGSPRSDLPGRRSSSWAAGTCRAASAWARRCHWSDPDNSAGTPRRTCPPAWRRSKVSARSGVETLGRPPAARRTVYRETPPRGLSAGCSAPGEKKERSDSVNSISAAT